MKSTRIILATVVSGAAVLVGTATAAGPTPPGLEAYGKRLQGEARVYQQLHREQQGPTQLGIKAYGQRLEGEARIYQQLQQAQQQGPTALGLKAYGERLQGEAAVYRQLGSGSSASQVRSFDWSDAGLGALVGFVFAAGCAGAFLAGRQFRRARFAAF